MHNLRAYPAYCFSSSCFCSWKFYRFIRTFEPACSKIVLKSSLNLLSISNVSLYVGLKILLNLLSIILEIFYTCKFHSHILVARCPGTWIVYLSHRCRKVVRRSRAEAPPLLQPVTTSKWFFHIREVCMSAVRSVH